MQFQNLHLQEISEVHCVLIKQHIFAVSYLESACSEVAVKVFSPLWVFTQGKQGNPCFGNMCILLRTFVCKIWQLRTKRGQLDTDWLSVG